MADKGKIYLLPMPLGEHFEGQFSPVAIEIYRNTKIWITERARTFRRFYKLLNPDLDVSQLSVYEINSNEYEIRTWLRHIDSGQSVGVVSEAGVPGIADPGSDVIRLAHQLDISVVPIVGPSSIMLSLMASGLNGQLFTFHGYLSNKKPALIQELKKIELDIQKTGKTHIFIETPYRNTFILEAIKEAMNPSIKLCIAANISQPDEWIKTRDVLAWKKTPIPDLHKIPCIFLLG